MELIRLLLSLVDAVVIETGVLLDCKYTYAWWLWLRPRLGIGALHDDALTDWAVSAFYSDRLRVFRDCLRRVDDPTNIANQVMYGVVDRGMFDLALQLAPYVTECAVRVVCLTRALNDEAFSTYPTLAVGFLHHDGFVKTLLRYFLSIIHTDVWTHPDVVALLLRHAKHKLVEAREHVMHVVMRNKSADVLDILLSNMRVMLLDDPLLNTFWLRKTIHDTHMAMALLRHRPTLCRHYVGIVIRDAEDGVPLIGTLLCYPTSFKDGSTTTWDALKALANEHGCGDRLDDRVRCWIEGGVRWLHMARDLASLSRTQHPLFDRCNVGRDVLRIVGGYVVRDEPVERQTVFWKRFDAFMRKLEHAN